MIPLGFLHRTAVGRFGASFIPGGSTVLALTDTGGGGKKKKRIDTNSPEFRGTIEHVQHGHGIGSHIGTGRFARAAVAAAGPVRVPQAAIVAGPGAGPCRWPARIDPNTGECKIFLGDEPGFDDPSTGAGAAVRGRHGAALEPVREPTITRRCLRGMVLGNDGLCYNKRDITNAERWWPRGRRPLLTGGEMRAISVAARAAGKLETKTKQLRKMGMLKPLPKRGRIRSGPTEHHHHTS